ncbi:3-phenylpropionate dioxygenase, beta subunit (plasmid) [Rhodococcus sp. WAY2]|uniref:Biphenyl dioxygenase small subunit n=2 Tax=Rhodococcus TaxID=1827 RepID=A3KCY5_RHORH|nr:3-phenylpropionate dioxygenase, beta subunit [Rhodococcus sp. WAY2]BAF48492.1 biphenyl dioxygenase small subunit [Rhodococcus rhodochrous]BAF48521.1 biphenyl dioxygenase small subunit [Rhodococcus sp. HA99]
MIAMTLLDETPPGSLAILSLDVAQFYYHEARLLDERRYDEWIGLFTSESTYWAPVRVTREGEPDRMKPGELALFDDDYGTLELRVASLSAKSAWAEIPPSRTRRLITNVTATESEVEGQVFATSNFLTFRSRLEATEHTFVGMREDILVRDGASWHILERKILLDHNTFTSDNISVLF